MDFQAFLFDRSSYDVTVIEQMEANGEVELYHPAIAQPPSPLKKDVDYDSDGSEIEWFDAKPILPPKHVEDWSHVETQQGAKRFDKDVSYFFGGIAGLAKRHGYVKEVSTPPKSGVAMLDNDQVTLQGTPGPSSKVEDVHIQLQDCVLKQDKLGLRFEYPENDDHHITNWRLVAHDWLPQSP